MEKNLTISVAQKENVNTTHHHRNDSNVSPNNTSAIVNKTEERLVTDNNDMSFTSKINEVKNTGKMRTIRNNILAPKEEESESKPQKKNFLKFLKCQRFQKVDLYEELKQFDFYKEFRKVNKIDNAWSKIRRLKLKLSLMTTPSNRRSLNNSQVEIISEK